MEKQYVKGFILDRNMVAKVAGVESPTDLDACLDGYKFIGAVHRNTQPANHPRLENKR